MRNLLLLTVFILLYSFVSYSQQYYYSDNYTDQGFEVLQSTPENIRILSSVTSWNLGDISVNREILQKVELPGHFLPNDEGMPDLPGSGKYIAVPRDAVARLEITGMQVETLQNIDLAPAPRIPKTTENGPLFYTKNQSVYNTNAFYPANPVKLSEPTQIRGVDVVMLGITPFQYNPVTKELRILRDIEVEVVFEGGNGQFGDERLRSRWWEPLLSDALLNYDELTTPTPTLPQLGEGVREEVGAEYLVICPDDPDFLSWADTIKLFRSRQGISTDVVTTTETGGNTVTAIKNYIDAAYNTWDIPPAAILILGDYGSTGARVIAPIWNNYCASDNIFGDVNDDDLPDIVMARIPAQNATHLQTMIGKFLDYERNPPVDPDYYAHPITALGWQTERWFQICIEVVGGFFKNNLGKDPVRINAVYGGNPIYDPWSTAPNTNTVLNYFGPNGLGYIPSTPATLGNWNGGNSTDVNNAINSGTFLLLHRDHGFEQGWGEPDYTNSHLSGLDNDLLPFVYSVNCLTGKYNISGECFAEAFYRQPKRALGIIAATEVSYSFVNDTYVWGAFDNMWPEFMPDYGSTPEHRGLLPAFSNAAGKFFLEQSSWPYNTGNKEVTYHLFHHFGDAFMTLYSDVPVEILVLHNEHLLGSAETFSVNAEEGSFIALSVEGEIIGTAEGTGTPVDIDIIPQQAGTMIDIVVTKTNCFRYETTINTIAPDAPYVVYQNHEINDETGNDNGQLDYAEESLLSLTMQNLGLEAAQNVSVFLSTDDPYVQLTDNVENAGDIAAGASLTLIDAFSIIVADSIPDGHIVIFNIQAGADGDFTWNSSFYLVAHAPVLELNGFTIDDAEGNDNGKIDPGEMASIIVDIRNSGSASAFNLETLLSGDGFFLTVLTGSQSTGILNEGESTQLVYQVEANESTPGGYNAKVDVFVSADYNLLSIDSLFCVIGDYTALILDLDPVRFSGPVIMETFNNLGFFADYSSNMVPDLSTYRNVFVCLGSHFTNHVLTASEATALKNFLDNGGNLYMEGLLTWYTDPQTIVHPMFNISPVYTNYYQIDSIYSRAGTFTDGMLFPFDNEKPYCNYQIHSIEPAFEIFSMLPDSLPSAVAYEAPGYKTIGTTMQFGGLVNNGHPSTRRELLARILTFFGETLTGEEEILSENLTQHNVNVFPNPFTSTITFRFNLEKNSHVELEIYDISGKIVTCLLDQNLDAGRHQANWNISSSNSILKKGMYFYRYNCGNENLGGKLILIE